jgi:hypothetical protein
MSPTSKRCDKTLRRPTAAQVQASQRVPAQADSATRQRGSYVAKNALRDITRATTKPTTWTGPPSRHSWPTRNSRVSDKESPNTREAQLSTLVLSNPSNPSNLSDLSDLSARPSTFDFDIPLVPLASWRLVGLSFRLRNPANPAETAPRPAKPAAFPTPAVVVRMRDSRLSECRQHNSGRSRCRLAV